MNAFDLTNTPLQRGTTLLEASAGTGKTYTIEGLVLRLIVEHNLAIREILVVTYTEAATHELRGRIRNRIRAALLQLEPGAQIEDPALLPLDQKPEADRQTAHRRLQSALLEFDEACIFTIHAFCQRMLREFSFECGLAFDAELLTDDQALLPEIAQDVWRGLAYGPQGLAASLYAAARKGKPIQALSQLLRTVTQHVETRLRPSAADEIRTGTAQENFCETLQSLSVQWERKREDFSAWLREQPALSKSQRDGYPEARREELIETLGRVTASDPPSAQDILTLGDLCTQALQTNTTKTGLKKFGLPEHPFTSACDQLDEAVQAFISATETGLLREALARLEIRKQERNILLFSDLLSVFARALDGPSGQGLCSVIGSRMKAALIDEFQDTDPVQWQIFSHLFQGGSHFFYLIGDPKQAIYRFRGADIFTYLQAARSADSRFSLSTNWRSDLALVQAVNAFFSVADNPFLFDEITYSHVTAAQGGPSRLETHSNRPEPLQALLISDGGEKLTVDAATRHVGESIVREIRTLLGNARMDNHPLRASDIAILVRKHGQGKLVQSLLREAGIPSVMLSESSVYSTAEAEQLLQLLHALTEPMRTQYARGVLCGPLGGVPAGILSDERGHAANVRETFLQLRQRWNQLGFMPMFRQCLEQFQTRERLLRESGGERALTNFLHLGELLHNAETLHNLSPEALLRWFTTQRQRPDLRESDAHELRMESDAQAVQIVTAHKSKGLEYPVVFAPFFWAGLHFPTLRKKPASFHDESENCRVLDTRGLDALTADEQAAAVRELVADEIRLLYVALTRARHRCYLYCAHVESFSTSSLANALGVPDWSQACQALEAISGETIHMADTQSEADAETGALPPTPSDALPELAPRIFTRTLDWRSRVDSFTSLVHGRGDESPERLDPSLAPEASEPKRESIHAFPKGARAGDFFHAVLEHLDFQADLPARERLVQHLARQYGYTEDWHARAALQCVSDVLATPLNPDGTLQLQRIGQRDTLRELEWTMPCARLSLGTIAGVLRNYGDPWQSWAGTLTASANQPAGRFLKGFIDLVCRCDGRYAVLDWKSNWLGPDAAAYTPDALARAMEDALYFLQALLYLTALDAWLENRLPDYDYTTHCAGAYYVFLRGVQPGTPGSGISTTQPPSDLIRELRQLHDNHAHH